MSSEMSAEIPTEITTEATYSNERPRLVSPNFLTEIIDRDLKNGRYSGVVTRFPPEPNGYPHIGHAKSICLNFGLAQDYGGECNLRFDDTNPDTEKQEYADAMIRDIRWLGFQPSRVLYASDYFERFYQCALQLIHDGQAYVDSVSDEEMRSLRGDTNTPGQASQYRDRSVAENLDLFARMRAGEFAGGAHVLRGKIDLASPNFKLRDPVLYRIVHGNHYRTGTTWKIYPLYDFAHPIEDFIEGVSHSICTLEFENNRAIYDWLLENLRGKCGLPESPRPYQHEFARFNLDYTLMSKRKLLALVQGQTVSGWDDPRMPTISALRRRGVRPNALRELAARIGVGKTNSRTEVTLFDSIIRDDLNAIAPRVLAVTRPIKLLLTNYGEVSERIDAPLWPHDVVPPADAPLTRPLSFSNQLWIEADDFAEVPTPGFHRLSVGARVRLRHAYIIRCDGMVKDAAGQVIELHCTVERDTLGRAPADGAAMKGIIHWLDAKTAIPAEFRLYDRLFRDPDPEGGEGDFKAQLPTLLNPTSLVVTQGFIEASVLSNPTDTRYQFERLGYFWQDTEDSKPYALVFNRIIGLRDSFAKTTATTPQPTRSKASKAEKPQPQAQTEAPLSAAALALVAQYSAQYQLSDNDAKVLAREPKLAGFFAAAAPLGDPKTLVHWVVNDLAAPLKADNPHITPEKLVTLLKLLESGDITRTTAKTVLEQVLANGTDPVSIVESQDLRTSTDTSALEAIIDTLLAANPDKLAAYRAGRTGMIGFFMGQVMKATQNKVEPNLVQPLIEAKLKQE
jgi:glutaminyl-tRNA synthetase